MFTGDDLLVLKDELRDRKRRSWRLFSKIAVMTWGVMTPASPRLLLQQASFAQQQPFFEHSFLCGFFFFEYLRQLNLNKEEKTFFQLREETSSNSRQGPSWACLFPQLLLFQNRERVHCPAKWYYCVCIVRCFCNFIKAIVKCLLIKPAPGRRHFSPFPSCKILFSITLWVHESSPLHHSLFFYSASDQSLLKQQEQNQGALQTALLFHSMDCLDLFTSSL